jgi:hypothetical protein
MVATGDASVDQAKRLGGITEVYSIDASSFSVFGFLTCTSQSSRVTNFLK